MPTTTQAPQSPIFQPEATMRFALPPYHSGFGVDVYRAPDGSLIETALYSGQDYGGTFLSLTCQVGCALACSHCRVSELPIQRNISADEYVEQVRSVLASHEGVRWYDQNLRLKVTFGRAGEPLHNKATVQAMQRLAAVYGCAFQVFTVMPRALVSSEVRAGLMAFAADYGETLQLVISMHSSDEAERRRLMPGARLTSFEQMAAFGGRWSQRVPKRKVSLSYALMDDTTVDLDQIEARFSPEHFALRFALYVPSSKTTQDLHPPSVIERLERLVQESKTRGYTTVRSPAAPTELVYDARPLSGLRMLVRSVGTAME